MLEVGAVAHRFMFELGARVVNQGGAALFLDYGSAVTGFGDTLQAVRAHKMVSPLSEPGECDLTAHVDFAAMARSASAAGAAVHGPIDQGDFLRALGIDLRTRALAERAPERADEFETARRRLVGKGDNEMGALFKAMAVAKRAAAGSARIPDPAGESGEIGVTGAEAVRSTALSAPGLAHAFFTRRGGVSTGLYESLNGGVGSRDEALAVAVNRARMAAALGVAPDRLAIPYQVHSPDVLAIEAPFAPGARPRCDGLATATLGLALGVTGADCGMILFCCDPQARVIGAAHAGWKGALFGVVEATVAAMARLGARPERIAAALGPCIAQASYEVGPEFVAAFSAGDRRLRAFLRAKRATLIAPCSICTAISPSGRGAPASASSTISASTPTPTKRASSATVARRIARTPTTDAWLRRSHWPDGRPWRTDFPMANRLGPYASASPPAGQTPSIWTACRQAENLRR